MTALTTIGDYLRLHGSALGEKVLGQFPPLHEPADPVSPFSTIEATTVPRSGVGDHGHRETMGRGAVRGGRRRVRHREDFDLTRKRPHTCGWASVHDIGNGAAATRGEMGSQRGDSDPSNRRPSIRHRWMPERCCIEWIQWR